MVQFRSGQRLLASIGSTKFAPISSSTIIIQITTSHSVSLAQMFSSILSTTSSGPMFDPLDPFKFHSRVTRSLFLKYYAISIYIYI